MQRLTPGTHVLYKTARVGSEVYAVDISLLTWRIQIMGVVACNLIDTLVYYEKGLTIIRGKNNLVVSHSDTHLAYDKTLCFIACVRKNKFHNSVYILI